MYRDDREALALRIEDRDELVRKAALAAHLVEGRSLARAAEIRAEQAELAGERRSMRRVDLFARASTYLGGAVLILTFALQQC
jgi:hypothetical protein